MNLRIDNPVRPERIAKVTSDFLLKSDGNMQAQRNVLFEKMAAGEIDLILTEDGVAIGALNGQARENIRGLWKNRIKSEEKARSTLKAQGYLGRAFSKELNLRMQVHNCPLILNRPFEEVAEFSDGIMTLLPPDNIDALNPEKPAFVAFSQYGDNLEKVYGVPSRLAAVRFHVPEGGIDQLPEDLCKRARQAINYGVSIDILRRDQGVSFDGGCDISDLIAEMDAQPDLVEKKVGEFLGLGCRVVLQADSRGLSLAEPISADETAYGIASDARFEPL